MQKILMTLGLTFSVMFLITQPASADVLDRINSCESSDGANGCVYDVLRELARNSGGSPTGTDQILSYCQCEVRGYAGVYLVAFSENLTRGTRKSYDLFYYQTNEIARCDSTLRTHPRCK